MKKLFQISITLSVILILALYACKKTSIDSAEPIEQQKQFKPEDFAFIGKQHNQKLDAVYKALVSKTNSMSHRTGNILSLSREEAISISEETLVEDINLQVELSEALRTNTISFVVNTFDGVPIMENDKLYTQSFANSQTPTVINILDRLNTLLSMADSSLTTLHSGISTLEAEVSTLNLTAQEQLIIYAASNVARYSSQYWVDNGDSWEQLAQGNLGGRNNIAARSFWGWVRNVVRGDVAGGGAAAAVTWLANSLPGAGQIAYGSAIALGATGGSVYNAIDYFF